MIEALKILVIDDELIDQKSIKRAISKSEIVADISFAANGKEALEIVSDSEFDCIFVDYLLPDIDGIELVKQMVAKGVDVPMIVVTSQTDPTLSEQALNAGATNYLTKSLISPEGVSLIIRNSISINKTQKELEIARNLADKNAAVKQSFLANMSHEIRTPMNAIIGYTRLLLDMKLGKKESDYLTTIYASSENLLMIINDILDFSKIESGKLTIEKINFNLKHVFENVVRVLGNHASSRGIFLKLDYPDDLPRFLLGDPYRINQIMLNLTSNAIKFTNEGGVTIRLAYEVNQESASNLTVAVSDTGIGISEENQKRLFESFTQAESSTTREYGGTGLGLSIVKQLTELMEGTISVSSEENVGSKFELVLPMEVGSEVKISGGDGALTLNKIGKDLVSKKRVLLVDDNEVNRNLAKVHFDKLGCNCSFAVDGLDATKQAIGNEYDIIFMDIQMPKIDGIEATKMILAEKPESKIVGMSAHVLTDEIERCYQEGMIGYLMKPYKRHELFDICYELFGFNVLQEDIFENQLTSLSEKKAQDHNDGVKHGLDLTNFKEDVGDDPDLIRDILRSFQNNFREFVSNKTLHLKNQDLKGVRGILHKIAPGVSMLGYEALYHQIKDLEIKADTENNIDNLVPTLTVIEENLTLFSEEINEYLNHN